MKSIRMKSIQGHLTLWLAVVMMSLSIASGGTLIAWLRRATVQEFDRSLLVDAHALQSLVTQRPNGRLDVDVDLRSLSEFSGKSATAYFLFEDLAGKQVAASNAARIETPQVAPTKVWDARLPNGVPGRAIRVEFAPSIEDADEKPAAASHGHSSKATSLWLTVARDRRPLDAILLRTTLAIAAASAVFSIAAVLAAVFIVRRGLASLRGLASEVAEVDVSSRGSKFDIATRPAELVPIVERLNELLGRMTVALARERQFTAAVSHELRTPIAELRSAADIALREPDDVPLTRRAVIQSQEIAIQMQTMVSTLLTIANAEPSAEPLAIMDIHVRRQLDRGIERRSADLRARGIGVENRVPCDAVARANGSLLAGVIENVIGNAAQYATPNTPLLIDASMSQGHLDLIFENQQSSLSRDDIGHVFDPFWRSDQARSNGQHVGLGLTLVRAYCAAMDATISADVTNNNRFTLRLRLRAPNVAHTDVDNAKRELATTGVST